MQTLTNPGAEMYVSCRLDFLCCGWELEVAVRAAVGNSGNHSGALMSKPCVEFRNASARILKHT